MAIIYTCYGGGFASIPAYIGDLFGTKQLGAIHGYILTAWAAAGLAGPLFSSFIRDITGNYTQSLMVFSGLFFIAFIISLLIRKDIQQLREKTYLLLPLSQPDLNLNLTESQSKGNF